MFIKTIFHKFTIMHHPQASTFLVGFQKHSKTKANILRLVKHIDLIKIPDAWLQTFKNNGTEAFRLTRFYEHKFSANLENIEMNLDDFIVPQRRLDRYEYNRFEMQDTFSNNLKKNIKFYCKNMKRLRHDTNS